MTSTRRPAAKVEPSEAPQAVAFGRAAFVARLEFLKQELAGTQVRINEVEQWIALIDASEGAG